MWWSDLWNADHTRIEVQPNPTHVTVIYRATNPVTVNLTTFLTQRGGSEHGRRHRKLHDTSSFEPADVVVVCQLSPADLQAHRPNIHLGQRILQQCLESGQSPALGLHLHRHFLDAPCCRDLHCFAVYFPVKDTCDGAVPRIRPQIGAHTNTWQPRNKQIGGGGVEVEWDHCPGGGGTWRLVLQYPSNKGTGRPLSFLFSSSPLPSKVDARLPLLPPALIPHICSASVRVLPHPWPFPLVCSASFFFSVYRCLHWRNHCRPQGGGGGGGGGTLHPSLLLKCGVK